VGRPKTVLDLKMRSNRKKGVADRANRRQHADQPSKTKGGCGVEKRQRRAAKSGVGVKKKIRKDFSTGGPKCSRHGPPGKGNKRWTENPRPPGHTRRNRFRSRRGDLANMGRFWGGGSRGLYTGGGVLSTQSQQPGELSDEKTSSGPNATTKPSHAGGKTAAVSIEWSPESRRTTKTLRARRGHPST